MADHYQTTCYDRYNLISDLKTQHHNMHLAGAGGLMFSSVALPINQASPLAKIPEL